MFKGVELRAVNGTRKRGLAMSKATSDKGAVKMGLAMKRP
jgi:hypothetical protein